jgi:hypothetical protein
MAQQRLPIVDGDDGDWGDILNQFLEKEHYNTGLDNPANGGHQTITIRPGTAAPNSAPLKFNSGTLLTSPEAGAVEFFENNLYVTQTAGPTRLTIAAYNSDAAAVGDLYYKGVDGNLERIPIGTTAQVLTVSGGVPTWDASPPALNWTYLVSSWDTAPTLTAPLAGGSVYTYILDSVTRYRFVPEPYVAAQDAFYNDFNGMSVTDLVTRRSD